VKVECFCVEIVRPDAEQFVGLVDAAVEQHVVVGHVEMAVVVDPGRLHPHHGGDEGRKEQRFEVGAVQHSHHPGTRIMPYLPRDGILLLAMMERFPSIDREKTRLLSEPLLAQEALISPMNRSHADRSSE
jgi:hypothetical protein